MTTSANVIEYRIEKDGEIVGYHRQNVLCKNRDEELLKFQPLSEHIITPFGYDEEEDYWEGEPRNLLDYMEKRKLFSKEIRDYFDNEEVTKNG